MAKSNGKGIVAVAGIMLVAAAHGNAEHAVTHAAADAGHAASTAAHAVTTAIGGGDSYTPSSWARAVLRAEGDPRSPCNMGAMLAWEGAEGGHWNNSAAYNPLNSTMPEPGSSTMNSVGVRVYTSWRQGLRATIDTLNNGNYGNILAALRSGDSAQAVADAVGNSPWGTGGFAAGCQ